MGAPQQEGNLQAHGGYLFWLEKLTQSRLISLGRKALALECEASGGCSILVSVFQPGRIVRLAYGGAPFAEGSASARWYLTHHALASLLSCDLKSAVHVYVLDPDALEEVTSYANGRRVGGERLEYDHFEFPERDDEDPNEAAFERAKRRWPLGHLARIFGIKREILENLPEVASYPLNLDGSDDPTSAEDALFPPPHSRWF